MGELGGIKERKDLEAAILLPELLFFSDRMHRPNISYVTK